MHIQYIKHSGFLLETEDAVFIFDYYEGDFKKPDPEKQIYFFVSHKHADHFNRHIFEFVKEYPKIVFIISNDAKMNEKYMDRHEVPKEARDKILYAHKNAKFDLSERIHVETLTSTDEGVAYIVTYYSMNGEPVSIYHAGDLNWWSWAGETKQEYEDMTARFKKEVKKLEGRHFDYAFLTLDGRQEERFWWGFDYIMRNTDVKYAFPMHCWEDYTVIERFRKMDESEGYRDRIVSISHQGQNFDL